MRYRQPSAVEKKDLQTLENLLLVFKTLEAIEKASEQVTKLGKGLSKKAVKIYTSVKVEEELPELKIIQTFMQVILKIDRLPKRKRKALLVDRERIDQMLASLGPVMPQVKKVRREIPVYREIESKIDEPSATKKIILALERTVEALWMQLSPPTAVKLGKIGRGEVVRFMRNFCREISPLPKPGEWRP